MKPNDRQKEIDAFHELKRRGEQKNRELEATDISNKNYSRRLQSLKSLDYLGQAIDCVIGKKRSAPSLSPSPSPTSSQVPVPAPKAGNPQFWSDMHQIAE